jgi:hypothetical protein
MKGIIITFALGALAFVIIDIAWSVDHTTPIPAIFNDETDSLLDDRWYTAIVTYSNHKKILKTTSDLKVEVKNNKVIKIDLGNGKILGSDEKESDYIYSGGVLSFEYDLRIKAKITKTSIKIKEVNGNLSFYDILIL